MPRSGPMTLLTCAPFVNAEIQAHDQERTKDADMDTTAVATTATTTTVADGLTIELEALFITADFDRFTRDPLGYSDYDWDDPITLEEFSCGQALHGTFADSIA